MWRNCPNNRIMLLREDGENESTDEEEEDALPPLEYKNGDEEEVHAEQGELLVVKRSLSVQSQVDTALAQRENLFHSRCKVNGKVCSLIIDVGSCYNVSSAAMVEKLKLKTLKKPIPCKLQRLNECGAIRVTRQVKISFSIGGYADVIMCDVIPMQATHIILGRQWQFDTITLHDGYTNKYTFTHLQKKFTLSPMTPQEVFEDQKALAGEKSRKETTLSGEVKEEK